MIFYKTDHSKILKRADQKGLIVVHMDKPEWATVQDVFREVECGGNLPVDTVTFIFCNHSRLLQNQCSLKSRTQKRLNVIEYITNGCLRFYHNIVL